MSWSFCTLNFFEELSFLLEKNAILILFKYIRLTIHFISYLDKECLCIYLPGFFVQGTVHNILIKHAFPIEFNVKLKVHLQCN